LGFSLLLQEVNIPSPSLHVLPGSSCDILYFGYYQKVAGCRAPWHSMGQWCQVDEEMYL
jgi:hypothetical protein